MRTLRWLLDLGLLEPAKVLSPFPVPLGRPEFLEPCLMLLSGATLSKFEEEPVLRVGRKDIAEPAVSPTNFSTVVM